MVEVKRMATMFKWMGILVLVLVLAFPAFAWQWQGPVIPVQPVQDKRVSLQITVKDKFTGASVSQGRVEAYIQMWYGPGDTRGGAEIQNSQATISNLRPNRWYAIKVTKPNQYRSTTKWIRLGNVDSRVTILA